MPTLKHLQPGSNKSSPSRVLCLDLGNKTGFARVEYPDDIDCPDLWKTGTYNLQPHYKPSTMFTPAFRLFQFTEMLRALCLDVNGKCKVDLIAYEVVVGRQAGGGSGAAHLWGSWESLLLMFCTEHDIPLVGYGVTEIKKRWTDEGYADKDTMMNECRKRGFYPADDNESDAIALAHLLAEDLTTGVFDRLQPLQEYRLRRILIPRRNSDC